MKSFKTLYFLPAVIYAAFFVWSFARYRDPSVFGSPLFWFNLLVMTAAGILLCRGRVWGAWLGIAFGVLWVVYDIVHHRINGWGRLVPLEIVCIPLAIYYIYCWVAVKTSPKR